MDKHAKRSSLLHYPVLIVFTLFFVGLFALDLITPDRAYSEMENTTLSQRPALTQLSAKGLNSYFTAYTKYVKDQAFGRDQWISLQSMVETTLFLVVVGWAMFVGNDTGVSFGLLFQKLFIPSGGVSPLYFLRNYGVLLIVSVICCTPLIEKIWNLLRRNVVTRCATILALLVVSTAYVVGSTNSPFLYFNF